jgi:hypothetical protein
MSLFVQATPAPAPKTTNAKTVSLIVVAVLLVLAVAQLFKFEKFFEVFGTDFVGGEAGARIFAAFIVTFEVGALPFLLGMRLSPAMRVMSMGAGWCVAFAWFVVSLWENVTHTVAHSGFLGTTVSLPTGWWSVLFSVAFGVLVAWASWGMWPCQVISKHK